MLKSYNFWIRLVAVLVLLLRIVGSEFGFDVDSGLIIDLATAIASVLVVLGVIQVPVSTTSSTKDGENKNGGNFMKTFEQIKNDIGIAKEKVVAFLGENAQSSAIIGILDGIMEEGEATEQQTLQETTKNSAEVVDTTNETTLETIEITEPVEVVEDKAIKEEGSENVNELEEEVENLGGIEEVQPMEALVDEGVATQEISLESENKLNEILKEKIREIIERDMDEILAKL